MPSPRSTIARRARRAACASLRVRREPSAAAVAVASAIVAQASRPARAVSALQSSPAQREPLPHAAEREDLLPRACARAPRPSACLESARDGLRAWPLDRRLGRPRPPAIEPLGVELARPSGCSRDLLVHHRLRERRLVALVVAVPAVADEVDDHVAPERLAELDRQPRRLHDRLGVVAVDVEDRGLDRSWRRRWGSGVNRSSSGDVVKPIWLLTMMWIVPPVRKPGSSRQVRASRRRCPGRMNAASPWISTGTTRCALGRRRDSSAWRGRCPRPPG